jgi:predicted Zn-dependent protease
MQGPNRIGVALMLAASLIGVPAEAWAQRPSLIRDAETEDTIRAYATPLFSAAGLSPNDVRIFIVRDSGLNAFVAGGQNLFLNTGLIQRAENANQVIGVIAHEAGHIAGGHLARLHDELKGASAVQMLSMVLAAVAAASGRPDAGMAVIGAGSTVAQSTLLQYSRTQESAADQAALSFLDRSGQSSRGLLQFLEILSGQELLSSARQSAYVRSHPLTRERIDHVRQHLASSRFADAATLAEFDRAHLRVKAKLAAFLDDPKRTLAVYKADDTAESARYARAIAHYRIPDLAQALPLMDGLIREFPDDPYYWETKGQILFENGRIAEAADTYRRAVELRPSSALIRVGLAQAQLELGRPELLDSALANLNEAVRRERDFGLAWRLLAVAHGRNNNIGEAALALAEQAMAEGRRPEALGQAQRALRLLPQGSPSWLRAQDIQVQAERRNR